MITNYGFNALDEILGFHVYSKQPVSNPWRSCENDKAKPKKFPRSRDKLLK
jgi:hypothetical protein